MLGRSRGRQASAAATYAVLWANLRHRHPGLRTVLLTGASERDDATAPAVGLAEAVVRGGYGPAPGQSAEDGGDGHGVLVIRMGPATGYAVDSLVPSVQVIAAQSPAQVHSLLHDARKEFGLAIVVAPAPQTGLDCISVADTADAVVLVATSGRTHYGDAQLAASLLRQVGVTPSAALLLSKHGLRKRSLRSDAVRTGDEGQRVGYAERPAPPEVAG